MRPFARQLERLQTIPGVGQATAEVIIAETGGDMTRFRTAAHLASWAGVCPGHHESAGQTQVRQDPARQPLARRCALGTAAMAAVPYQGHTYLGARYQRLAPRLGKKKALVALEHSILTAVGTCSPTTSTITTSGATTSPDATPNAPCDGSTRQANALGFTIRFDPIHAA